MKKFLFAWGFFVLFLWTTFWAAIIWTAVHFIRKYW